MIRKRSPRRSLNCPRARQEKLQQSGVQPSEGFAFLGIMTAQLSAPLKPFKHYSNVLLRGLRRVLIIPPIMPGEANFSDSRCVFFSSRGNPRAEMIFLSKIRWQKINIQTSHCIPGKLSGFPDEILAEIVGLILALIPDEPMPIY